MKKWMIGGSIFGILVVLVVAGGMYLGKKQSVQEQWQHTLAEKETIELVCLGDSIWDLVRDETGIAAILSEELGITVYNCAVMGTSAAYFPKEDEEAEEWNPKNLPSMIQWMIDPKQGKLPQEVLDTTGIEQIDFTHVDYFLLAYGLNDYFKGIPREGENPYDVYTYAGALRSSIEALQERYPQAEIILLSPTYCQLYSYGKVVDDSDTLDYGGGAGVAYVETAQKVAGEYDILFVNNYKDMGINRLNGPKYLVDATHLTEAGRRKYAKNLARRMMEFQESKE